MNLDSLIVSSLIVLKTETPSPRVCVTDPRDFYSLTYRIKGDNTIYDKGVEIQSNAHALTLIPKNKFYTQHILTPSEQLVIHFAASKNISDEIHSFSLPLNCNIEYLFNSLLNQWEKKQDNTDLQSLSIFYNILALIRENVSQKTNSKSSLIQDSVIYMHKHFREPEFNISHLYKHTYISPAYYRRIFNEVYNCTPIEYLKNLRLNYAKQLLRDKQHTVSEVSHLSGFSSPAYFSYEFKRMTGHTPSQYL